MFERKAICPIFIRRTAQVLDLVLDLAQKRFNCLYPGPRVESSTISELIKCVKVDKI